MGNWSANILEANDSDTRFLTDLMGELSLKLVDTGPIHHNVGNDIWIDPYMLTIVTQ